MASKPPIVWYPAQSNNYTTANRPNSHKIDRIIVHLTQGFVVQRAQLVPEPERGRLGPLHGALLGR
jgi:hypothetical protein